MTVDAPVRHMVLSPNVRMAKEWARSNPEKVGSRPELISSSRQLRGIGRGWQVHVYDPNAELKRGILEVLNMLTKVSAAEVLWEV